MDKVVRRSELSEKAVANWIAKHGDTALFLEEAPKRKKVQEEKPRFLRCPKCFLSGKTVEVQIGLDFCACCGKDFRQRELPL